MRDQAEPEAGPKRLVAEINLLLDFISGRPNQTLAGGQQLRLPGQFKTHEEVLSRFFSIQEKLNQPDTSSASPSSERASGRVQGSSESVAEFGRGWGAVQNADPDQLDRGHNA